MPTHGFKQSLLAFYYATLMLQVGLLCANPVTHCDLLIHRNKLDSSICRVYYYSADAQLIESWMVISCDYNLVNYMDWCDPRRYM